jgi:hypothetical protein
MPWHAPCESSRRLALRRFPAPWERSRAISAMKCRVPPTSSSTPAREPAGSRMTGLNRGDRTPDPPLRGRARPGPRRCERRRFGRVDAHAVHVRPRPLPADRRVLAIDRRQVGLVSVLTMAGLGLTTWFVGDGWLGRWERAVRQLARRIDAVDRRWPDRRPGRGYSAPCVRGIRLFTGRGRGGRLAARGAKAPRPLERARPPDSLRLVVSGRRSRWQRLERRASPRTRHGYARARDVMHGGPRAIWMGARIPPVKRGADDHGNREVG